MSLFIKKSAGSGFKLTGKNSSVTSSMKNPSQVFDVQNRILTRDYPSIFQAWNNSITAVDYPTFISWMNEMSRHDLAWTGPTSCGLQWDTSSVGTSTFLATNFTTSSISTGQFVRKYLLSKNPNFVYLAEVRYRDALDGSLPSNSTYWLRDGNGNRIFSWGEGGNTFYRLDITNSQLRSIISTQARSIMMTGVFDGIMLDWWDETEYSSSRLDLLKRIRTNIGKDSLIIVNANDRTIPNSAPYVNGSFMECYNSPTATASNWATYATTLQWLESNLRQPRVNCLETWYATSRNDLNRMRATTTLGLTMSDGYTLFADPNTLPTPDHLHDWYSFYDTNLGKPISPGSLQSNGSWSREFTNGTVVYNPMGNSTVNITFSQQRRSAANGTISTTHSVPALDGDIFTYLN